MNPTDNQAAQETDPVRSLLAIYRWGLFALLLAGVSVPVMAPMLFAQDAKPKGDKFSEYVDDKGNISLPEDFETKFAHLGTIAVESKRDKPVDQLHVTYTRPKDIAAFQKNGKFSDGAVLVKAVHNVKKERLTTGQTSFAGDIDVWFVMIKDEKGRFKDNDLWGSGWGWALFDGSDRKEQIASDYSSECRTCHIPAKKNDWVFTQCYPLLKKTEPASAKTGDKDKPFDPADIAK
jgi:hypothetical protein